MWRPPAQSIDTATSTVGIGHSLLPRKTGTVALLSGVMPRRQATLVKVLRRMRMSTASDTLFDVPHVVLELLLPREGVAPVDLRPAGDAGEHLVAERLARRVPIQILDEQWPRADQTQVAAHHVPSCGSSSRLNVRSTRPNAVSRSASGSRSPALSRSDVIVRNL